MIIQFSTENFRSFKEEQTLSMIAKKRDKSNPDQVVTVIPQGGGAIELVRQVALLGANASGKSNLIKAIKALQRIVVESIKWGPDDLVPVSCNQMDAEWHDKPTIFKIDFILNEVHYFYHISTTKVRIQQEELYYHTSENVKKPVFIRVFDPKNETEMWTLSDKVNIDRDIFTKATRGNSPFLSLCAQLNQEYLLPVYRWFKDKITVIDFSANSPSPDNWMDTADEIDRNPEIKKFITEVIKASDLGINGIVVKKDAEFIKHLKSIRASGAYPRPTLRENRNYLSKAYRVMFSHGSPNSPHSAMISFGNESAGTRRLFALLAPWCKAIIHDQFLVIDEIDSSMHPAMVCHLLKGFSSACAREHHGQVLFSTHNTAVMNSSILRRDQIYFTEKTRHGSTRLIPLTDYSPRMGEAIEANYLSGAYGGIPILEKFPELPNGCFPIDEKEGQEDSAQL